MSVSWVRYFLISLLLLIASAHADKPETDLIALYGQTPAYRAFSISPDGRHISYIQRGEKNDIFVVNDFLKKEVVYSAHITKFKARRTQFITNEHVLLKGSVTTSLNRRYKRFEHSGALIYNLKTKKFRQAFKTDRLISPAQTGLGRIRGFNPEEKKLYMPAFGKKHTYNLYAVDINFGSAKLHARGTAHTRDFFINGDGKLLARENYNERKKLHSLQAYVDGEWNTIYEYQTDIPAIDFLAVSADEKSLLFIGDYKNHDAVYAISLETGDISDALFYKEGAEIDSLKLDINHKLDMVQYAGFLPDYEFHDKALEPMAGALIQHFSGNSVSFHSWTEDKNQMIVRVSGPAYPGAYYLYNLKKKSLVRLAQEYAVDDIAELRAIRYKARDGLEIPSILTIPSSVAKPKNMPLIVLPHGGPAAYDHIEFDWLAQYLARKGYLVLQPNFRGSSGFGDEHRMAGHGLWGKAMQDDVSDGVLALVKQGYADPERVCIMGGSYGGYSALAGGAFTPELYSCVIALNGVSDIPLMLRDDKVKYGRNHWAISYWEKIIANSDAERKKLKAISPYYFTKVFTSPVLLIHGKDDTIVPVRQSKLMHSKLKSSGKQSELVLLKGEDHYLSKSKTRVQMLKAVDQFLDKYNPVVLSRSKKHDL